jgi:hypothetical protein
VLEPPPPSIFGVFVAVLRYLIEIGSRRGLFKVLFHEKNLREKISRSFRVAHDCAVFSGGCLKPAHEGSKRTRLI